MRKPIRTALLAAVDADARRTLPLLLANAGIDLLAAVSDGVSAEKALMEYRSDLLVLQANLPLLDGVSLARRICGGSAFARRPRQLLLHQKEFPVPHRAKLEEMGVAFVALPAKHADFSAAIQELEENHLPLSMPCEKRADALLNDLGFPNHTGTRVLRCAAILCAEDERLIRGRNKTLYPMIGDLLGIAPAAAERALRHAIGAAWRSNQFENQHRIFADTVDAGRGQPTCGEMIACLADILRLEG